MSCLDLKKNKDDFYNYTINSWKMGELSNRSAIMIGVRLRKVAIRNRNTFYIKEKVT